MCVKHLAVLQSDITYYYISLFFFFLSRAAQPCSERRGTRECVPCFKSGGAYGQVASNMEPLLSS